jgi:hypothetical protein
MVCSGCIFYFFSPDSSSSFFGFAKQKCDHQLVIIMMTPVTPVRPMYDRNDVMVHCTMMVTLVKPLPFMAGS